MLDYLESVTPQTGFLFGALSMADLAVTPAFMNLDVIRVRIDPERWPRFAGLLERVNAETPMGPLNRLADALMRTPVEHHRDRLAEFGLKAAGCSHMGTTPRRGPMTAAI